MTRSNPGSLRCLICGGEGGENEVDNSWDLNLVLLNFCFERISIIHCFLSIQKMDH